MALDGIAAVQARIAEIETQLTGVAPGASSSSSDSSTSAQFASMLADAMNQGSTSNPLASGTDLTGADSGGLNISSLISQLTGNKNALGGMGGLSYLNQLSAPANSRGPIISSPKAEQFLADALAQRGKKYVYGASPAASNNNPTAFDCQGLVDWAATRQGIQMPSGATAQYLHIRDAGTTMTVQQALHTPGALLFHFGHEPKNLGDIPADGHVAISVGDGVHTIEARGHAYGTNVFDNAAGRNFNFAGMIPGM